MPSKIAFLVATLLLLLVAGTVASSLHGEGEQYLRRLSSKEIDPNSSIFRGNGAFVDGAETVYDDFSTAWRFLGFYTDCNVCLKDDDNGDDNDNGDGDDDGDGDEEFADPKDCLENGADTTVCRRYALWAAYVDEGYEGNGVSEYQYYDRQHRRWDKSACDENQEKNGDDDVRCVKMDCHNPSSKNFKLIGVYKDHQTSDFLENMIGYSGDCVWNDDEYKFMNAMNSNSNSNYNNGNNYNNNNNNGVTYWPPKKCTRYKHQKDGSYVYYDALPTASGNLDVALYTDDSCTVPYEGNDVTAYDAFGRDSRDIKSWNAAMDAFKICQPCVSYDTHTLSHTSKNGNKKNAYNANGDRYGDNYAQQEQDDAAADDAEGDDPFVCRDNLENDEPINQCEAFVEGGKDTMSVATYRDILRK